MRDPAMVMSLPVGRFHLWRTITQIAVLCSAIWRTLCIRLSHFFLSASDSLGHCHRRCPGSLQPQRTFPGFLMFAYDDCSSGLFAGVFMFALASAFDTRISSSFIRFRRSLVWSVFLGLVAVGGATSRVRRSRRYSFDRSERSVLFVQTSSCSRPEVPNLSLEVFAHGL